MRAIDKQWEEVNVRATNTLDNIEEDDLDRLDPNRNRRGSDVVVSKRRDAGMYELCVTYATWVGIVELRRGFPVFLH